MYTTSDVLIELDDRYESGMTVDYFVKHSDAFYEAYINSFEQNKKKRYGYRFVKRSFDIACSLLLLIFLIPFFLGIALAIKIDSKGPVLFKQARMGRNGKTFTCYKFRSMRTDAPKECATSLLPTTGQYQTKVGKMLRRFSLDELPQLWNVLTGTMSLIGYRPLILSEKNCNTMRERLGVLTMRPGISGYAQVLGRDDIYYKNKAIIDAEYVKKASLWLDIKLAFKTVVVVLTRKGYRS